MKISVGSSKLLWPTIMRLFSVVAKSLGSSCSHMCYVGLTTIYSGSGPIQLQKQILVVAQEWTGLKLSHPLSNCESHKCLLKGLELELRYNNQRR